VGAGKGLIRWQTPRRRKAEIAIAERVDYGRDVLLFVNKKKQKNFVHLGRGGVAAPGSKSKKFIENFQRLIFKTPQPFISVLVTGNHAVRHEADRIHEAQVMLKREFPVRRNDALTTEM
jgi:hypothetical protein